MNDKNSWKPWTVRLEEGWFALRPKLRLAAVRGWAVARTRSGLIGIGAALLVGGWGMTTYAKGQQQAELRDEYPASHILKRYRGWQKNGIFLMALGAGVIGFGAIRTNKEVTR